MLGMAVAYSPMEVHQAHPPAQPRPAYSGIA